MLIDCLKKIYFFPNKYGVVAFEDNNYDINDLILNL
jgi:hypothetical protein